MGAHSLTAQGALDSLRRLLEEHEEFESRAALVKGLLRDMLETRQEVHALGKLYDLRPAANSKAGETSRVERFCLPDEVVAKMLEREVLLAKTNLYLMIDESKTALRQLQSIQALIQQVGSSIVWDV